MLHSSEGWRAKTKVTMAILISFRSLNIPILSLMFIDRLIAIRHQSPNVCPRKLVKFATQTPVVLGVIFDSLGSGASCLTEAHQCTYNLKIVFVVSNYLFPYRDLSNNKIYELSEKIFFYNNLLEELWVRKVYNLVTIINFF